MPLFKVLFKHYAPKDSEAGVKGFLLRETAGARPEKEPELDGRKWMQCPEERFALGV